MAKDKKSSKAAGPASKSELSKPIESIKAGRVTKPIEKTKAAASKAAKEIEKKTKKKAKKEPTPEPSSDEDESTSASSDSSDDESDSEVETKAAPKVNGTSKAPVAQDDDEDDDDDDDDDSSEGSSDDEAPAKAAAPKANGTAKVNGTAEVNGTAKAADASDSDSDSSEADSDDEIDEKAGAKQVEDDSSDSSSNDDSDGDDEPKVNGKAKPAADESSDRSSSEDDDDETEDAKPMTYEKIDKKRKAEDPIEQTPKKSKGADPNSAPEGAYPNLFVGNLSWNIDEEWLTREFEEFGEIKGVRVITDRETGKSKGFGYVEFTDVGSAVKALEARNESELDGRNIRVDYSVPRQNNNNAQTPQQRSNDRAARFGDSQNQPSSTLFVGNVSFDADESMISDLFGEYGSVIGVRLPTDRETGSMKGFGYVEMASVDEAKAALEALNGSDLAGRAVRLDYSTPRSNDSPRGGRGGFDRGGRGGGRGRGGFDRGGRGGGRGGGFGDRGRGGARGGRGGSSFNRGGFGDFSGKKTSF